MTEEDKKEVANELERYLRLWVTSSAFTEAVQQIIKRHDTEKWIERNEKLLQRLPFFVIGLAIGLWIGILATHH